MAILFISSILTSTEDVSGVEIVEVDVVVEVTTISFGIVVYSLLLSYLPSNTALIVFSNGYLPWLQNFPSKSSKSRD